ncbi:hypothetical protein KY289_023554 [Solanum tuberosum]|nr:hypothetical protein KY289_023554 [Solanum tuberosum]
MEMREMEIVLMLLNGCFRWFVVVFRRWLVCCFDGKSEKLEKGSGLSVVFACWRKMEEKKWGFGGGLAGFRWNSGELVNEKVIIMNS